jgi:hypothetical protein
MLGAEFIVIETAVGPATSGTTALSVVVTEKLNVPAAVGVPLIVEPSPLSERPSGSGPVMIVA